MTQVHCSCADATRHLIHVYKEPLAPYLLDWELARLYINKSHVLFEFSSQIDVSLRLIKGMHICGSPQGILLGYQSCAWAFGLTILATIHLISLMKLAT